MKKIDDSKNRISQKLNQSLTYKARTHLLFIDIWCFFIRLLSIFFSVADHVWNVIVCGYESCRSCVQLVRDRSTALVIVLNGSMVALIVSLCFIYFFKCTYIVWLIVELSWWWWWWWSWWGWCNNERCSLNGNWITHWSCINTFFYLLTFSLSFNRIFPDNIIFISIKF